MVQKPNTEPPGLNFGHAIRKGSGRQWEDVVGSTYEVVMVVGSCIGQHKAGGGFGPKNQKLSHYGSVWGWICDAGGCVRSSALPGPPSHGNLSGGELGVSCLGGKE